MDELVCDRRIVPVLFPGFPLGHCSLVSLSGTVHRFPSRALFTGFPLGHCSLVSGKSPQSVTYYEVTMRFALFLTLSLSLPFVFSACATGEVDNLDAFVRGDTRTPGLADAGMDAAGRDVGPTTSDSGRDAGSDAPASCTPACTNGSTCVAGVCRCGAGMCAGASTCCGTACVDTQTNAANCGSCGMVCPTGRACTAGSCAVMCSVSCPAGTTCSGALCLCGTGPGARACAGGESCCGGACARTDTSANCGACGRTCAGSEECCGGTCRNTNADRANCGRCGNDCGSSADGCSAGSCTCGGAPACFLLPCFFGNCPL